MATEEKAEGTSEVVVNHEMIDEFWWKHDKGIVFVSFKNGELLKVVSPVFSDDSLEGWIMLGEISTFIQDKQREFDSRKPVEENENAG